jgi:hypothetical protein
MQLLVQSQALTIFSLPRCPASRCQRTPQAFERRPSSGLRTLVKYKHKAKITNFRLPNESVTQNKFQPGDLLVLFHFAKPRVSKRSPVYAGPFEVLSHYQNDVSCRHLVLHYFEKFYVDKLGMFHGTPEDGFKMAFLDRDQHVVLYIDAHRGVPSRHTGMEFGTRFADGDYLWLPYFTGIASTKAFETYCKRLTELQFLLITVKKPRFASSC